MFNVSTDWIYPFGFAIGLTLNWIFDHRERGKNAFFTKFWKHLSWIAYAWVLVTIYLIVGRLTGSF